MPVEEHCLSVCAAIIRLLQQEREKQGLSKYAVSKRSGLSQQAIGYLERGIKKPSLETIVRYAAAIEVDLADLVGRAAGSKEARRRN